MELLKKIAVPNARKRSQAVLNAVAYPVYFFSPTSCRSSIDKTALYV